MLELAEVNEVVNKAASTVLKRRTGVREVYSEPTAASDGRDALHITIVLKRGALDKIRGDMALDMLVNIKRALRAANEDRFPIIDYATEEELEAGGDTEC